MAQEVPTGERAQVQKPLKDCPLGAIVVFHGRAEEVVAKQGGLVALREDCGGKTRQRYWYGEDTPVATA